VKTWRAGHTVPRRSLSVLWNTETNQTYEAVVDLIADIVGMDVVEVSPPYDHADITAALANRVVLETLSAIARKRQDLRDGTRWEPLQPLLSERSAPIPEGTVQHHHTHLGHDQKK
jgi:Arginase family